MGKVRHLGLIADGGRRWAAREGVPLVQSYSITFERMGEFARAAYERGIWSLSLYLMSKANLARRHDEIAAFEEAACGFLSNVLPPVCEEFGVSVRIAGLPELVGRDMRLAVEQWQGSKPIEPRRCYLLIAYDPFDEIADALRTDSAISGLDSIIPQLWVPEKVDLVVRTGGAVTLSQFLPLQCGYARLVFLDPLYNDFQTWELLRVIDDHEAMNLVYGT